MTKKIWTGGQMKQLCTVELVCSKLRQQSHFWQSDVPVEAGQCLATWPQYNSANEQWMPVGQAGSAAEHPSSSPPVTSQDCVSFGAEGPALRQSEQAMRASQHAAQTA